jgi:methionyl-tRNA synthetase
MAEFAFQRALAAIWDFIGRVNRYVDAQAPWTLAKDPAKAERLRTVLWTLGESLRCLGILLAAFLPEAAAKIRAGIGAGEPRLADLSWGGLAAGGSVQKIGGLFPRVDPKTIGEEAAPGTAAGRAGAAPTIGETAPAKITIADFQKVDLRVAEVLAAEAVPKSKKLLKLSIKLGEETRTLVAGIAEHYAPQDIVGRKVIVVANLEPATLMGIQSNGMVLTASQEGPFGLLAVDRDVPSGAKVR